MFSRRMINHGVSHEEKAASRHESHFLLAHWSKIVVFATTIMDAEYFQDSDWSILNFMKVERKE